MGGSTTTKTTLRTPTLYLRLARDGHKTIRTFEASAPVVDAPIHVFVRSVSGGKPGPFSHLHTNGEGHICRFVSKAAARRLAQGTAYANCSRYRLFDSRAQYRGFCSGEIQVDPTQLEDADLRDLKIVEFVDAKGKAQHAFDWEVPRAVYRSFSVQVLRFLQKKSNPRAMMDLESLIVTGATPRSIEEFEEAIATAVVAVEMESSSAESAAGVEGESGLSSPPGARGPVSALPWTAWTRDVQTSGVLYEDAKVLRNVSDRLFFFSDAGLSLTRATLTEAKSKQEPKEEQSVRQRGQVWTLAPGAQVLPLDAKALGYDPNAHDAIADELRSRIAVVILGASEANPSWLKPKCEAAALVLANAAQPFDAEYPFSVIFDPDVSITPANSAAIRRHTMHGKSRISIESAIANALVQGIGKTRTRSSATDLSADAPSSSAVPSGVEIPVAATAFVFATGHQRLDHRLIDVADRVRAWMGSLPAELLSGAGEDLVVAVDGYASASGDAGYNEKLSRARASNVSDAVFAELTDRGNFDFQLRVDHHGEYTGRADNPVIDCLLQAEFHEEDAAAYGRIVDESTDNSWTHRVVRVEMRRRYPENQVVRMERFMTASYPIARLSVVGAVAIRRRPLGGELLETTYHAWVFVTPGTAIEVP